MADNSGGLLPPCEAITHTSVAVIGGGFAGLAAGWWLRQYGASVTVFEANNWIGGRVFTDPNMVPGKTVEIGAELIGLNHYWWWQFAQRFGLQLVELTSDKHYESWGLRVRRIFNQYEIPPHEWTVIEADLERVEYAIGVEAYPIHPDYPWLAENASVLDNTSVRQAFDRLFAANPPIHPLSRTVLEFKLANDNCAPVDRLSYLALLALVSGGRYPTETDPSGMMGYWRYTETHRCRGGNAQLATYLANDIGSVLTGHVVQGVAIDAEGVNVQCANGVLARFHYVILTAPPTSWPLVSGGEHYGIWPPRTYTHGPAGKYFAVYDYPFWLAPPGYGVAPAALSNHLGQVWNSTDNQRRPDVLAEVVAVFAGGDYFNRDQYHYRNALQSLFSPHMPSSGRLIDWTMWQHIWTGYVVPAPGEVTTIGPFLMQPYAGRMLFAGEQTCMGFFGYMQGALHSGIRAANQLIQMVCAQPDAVPEPTAVSWDRTQGV